MSRSIEKIHFQLLIPYYGLYYAINNKKDIDFANFWNYMFTGALQSIYISALTALIIYCISLSFV